MILLSQMAGTIEPPGAARFQKSILAVSTHAFWGACRRRVERKGGKNTEQSFTFSHDLCEGKAPGIRIENTIISERTNHHLKPRS